VCLTDAPHLPVGSTSPWPEALTGALTRLRLLAIPVCAAAPCTDEREEPRSAAVDSGAHASGPGSLLCPPGLPPSGQPRTSLHLIDELSRIEAKPSARKAYASATQSIAMNTEIT
jgi:hypothetical protein